MHFYFDAAKFPCSVSGLPAPDPKLHRSLIDSNLGFYFLLPRPDSAPGISVHGAGLEAANGIYVRTSFKVRLHMHKVAACHNVYKTLHFLHKHLMEPQGAAQENFRNKLFAKFNLMPSYAILFTYLLRFYVESFPCFSILFWVWHGEP